MILGLSMTALPMPPGLRIRIYLRGPVCCSGTAVFIRVNIAPLCPASSRRRPRSVDIGTGIALATNQGEVAMPNAC